MTCVGTWSFALEGVATAAQEIEKGGGCLDAVEKGINVVEDDPRTGRYYVGRGCYPNSEGVVQLDAAIMSGKGSRMGAVAALERYVKPISVARKVLEEPSLSMLVGTGAGDYARKQGFTLEDNDALLSEDTRKAYQEFKSRGATTTQTGGGGGNDTVDTLGSVAVGVSTSGPAFKPPGRVGDSPLVGSGFYAEDKIGAAAATGDGHRIMQYCPSIQSVKLMRDGLSPLDSVESVLRQIRESNGGKIDFDITIVSLNTKGDIGVATTVKEWTDLNGKVYEGFPYAYWRKDKGEARIAVHSPLFD